MSRSWWSTPEELYSSIVEAIADATVDPQRNGILGQETLAAAVGCHKRTLQRNMPQIVTHSTQMYPGYAVQCAVDPNEPPFHRYRLVDEQKAYERVGSVRRIRKGITTIQRGEQEVDVQRAGPAAKAAAAMIAAGRNMIASGEELLADAGQG